MSKPFIWVKFLATGHQADIHESVFDPERHERVERVGPSAQPRRPKPNVKRRRKTSASEAGTGTRPAEESASLVENAGDEMKEQANG